MAAQLGALKRQARQAAALSPARRADPPHEALLFYARWLAAEAEAETRAAELRAAEQAVAEADEQRRRRAHRA